jgi:hypothetical protein
MARSGKVFSSLSKSENKYIVIWLIIFGVVVEGFLMYYLFAQGFSEVSILIYSILSAIGIVILLRFIWVNITGKYRIALIKDNMLIVPEAAKHLEVFPNTFSKWNFFAATRSGAATENEESGCYNLTIDNIKSVDIVDEKDLLEKGRRDGDKHLYRDTTDSGQWYWQKGQAVHIVLKKPLNYKKRDPLILQPKEGTTLKEIYFELDNPTKFIDEMKRRINAE